MNMVHMSEERGRRRCLLGKKCKGIACEHCWSFNLTPAFNKNNNNNNNIVADDEDIPLTSCCNEHDDDDDNELNRPVALSDESDDNNDGVGYTNYKQPIRFRLGRYDGYATLGQGGRVSMHDSWENLKPSSSTNSDHAEHNDSSDEGDFVSYWGKDDDDDDDNDDESNTDSSFCSTDKQINLLEGEHFNSNRDASIDIDSDDDEEEDDDDDSRVEFTIRPIPLQYRQYQGGLALGQNTIHPSSTRQFGWFQREQLKVDDRVADNNTRSTTPMQRRHRNRNNGLWGWMRRRQHPILEAEFDNSERDEDCDGQLLQPEGGEDDSLLEASSSTDEIRHNCVFTTPELSQYDRALSNAQSNAVSIKQDNNIFGNDRRGRGGIFALPIVRPLFRTRPPGGFTDNQDNLVDDDESRGEDDLPSRRDHDAVVQSISQGIASTNDNMLLLDASNLDNNDHSKHQSRPPNLLERIFITRFLQSPDGGDRTNNRKMKQLHNLLRKEDWLLATSLLQSNPELAQTWYKVDRLYGGRYDGEALPIHAACALCPPASFIEMLGNLYPEGLLEKDKAFNRCSLHVACRSLADSSVIKVLTQMKPRCVMEGDSLKRVPLHYLIKNYTTFGYDDDDISISEGTVEDNTETEDGSDIIDNTNQDGMVALKILLTTNRDCVYVADHRGWNPLHVACSCSSRRGMIRVMRLLLKIWPESVNTKTNKDSDVFACVDMAGKHHPTKDKVIKLLTEAKFKLDESASNAEENKLSGDDVSNEDDDEDEEDEISDSPPEHGVESNEGESNMHLLLPIETHCPEGVLISLP